MTALAQCIASLPSEAELQEPGTVTLQIDGYAPAALVNGHGDTVLDTSAESCLTGHTFSSQACRRTAWVWMHTPSTASTTTSAPSDSLTAVDTCASPHSVITPSSEDANMRTGILANLHAS